MMDLFVRKSAFRFALESTARRAVWPEKEHAGRFTVLLEEEWAAVGFAFEVAAFEAAGVVFDRGRYLKDEMRVIDDALSLMF